MTFVLILQNNLQIFEILMNFVKTWTLNAYKKTSCLCIVYVLLTDITTAYEEP